jgi:hypothetical protein
MAFRRPKNPVLSAKDIEWAQTNWLPTTREVGWKYWAIVQPERIVAKVTMENLMREYSKFGLNAKFFFDPDEALKWLESQP